jgi:hypothetical protein
VGHRLDANEVVDLGMDFIEHMAPVAIATITDKEQLRQIKEGRVASPFHLMDPAAFPPLIQKIIKGNVFLNPTLSGTGRGFNHRREEYAKQFVEYFSQPGLAAYVPEGYVQLFLDKFAVWDRVSPADRKTFEAGYDRIELFVKMFSEAGGKIVAGSDPVNTGIPGLGIHQELQLLVDAGVRPMEALKGVWTYAAELIRKQKDLGTVEAGKFADLVVLDRDPLQDIANTRSINTVVLDGKLVDLSFQPDYRLPIPRAETEVFSVGPRIESLSPTVAAQGAADHEITLRGRFRPATKVTFNGTEVPAQFQDYRTMKIRVPAKLLNQAGTFPIQATDTVFGGKTAKSNSVFFMVRF